MDNLLYFDFENQYVDLENSLVYPSVSYIKENDSINFKEKELLILTATYKITEVYEDSEYIAVNDPSLFTKISINGEEIPFNDGETVYLPNEIGTYTLIGELKTNEISDYAFTDAKAMVSVNMPSTITYIGEEAFSYCSLESIELPSSLTTIAYFAFNSCDFTEIIIPNTVTSIGEHAFRNCKFEKITIPSSVEYFGEGIFLFGSIKEVIFEKGSKLKEIKKSSFQSTSLESIVLPENLEVIGSGVFGECYNLTSIELPKTLKTIGLDAFSYCESLTNINIPSGIEIIEENTFGDCTSLTSVTFDDNSQLKTIGSNAFYNCSMESFIIPDSVTIIGERAFNGCSNLTSINIPSGVTSIDFEAFAFCESLKTIKSFATTAPSVNNETFLDITSNGVLYYPSGSDYSSWMSTNEFYLGYYNWTSQEF